jgi:hypothetical protein
LVFEKNANFFAKNWEKSQKIVIITSTPGNSTLKKTLSIAGLPDGLFSNKKSQLGLILEGLAMENLGRYIL